MGRMYTVVADAIAVAAADDLLRISAPSDAAVILHEVLVTQEAQETSEQLAVQIQRSSTDGTGTAVVPEQLELGDPVFGGTCSRTITVDTTIDGLPIWRSGQNVLNGWHYLPTPEGRPTISPSGRIVVRMDTAPAASMTVNTYALFEEIGG